MFYLGDSTALKVLFSFHLTFYKYYPGKMELLSASFEVLKTKMTAKVEAILENLFFGKTSFALKTTCCQ
jgi:hypothetical protein